MTAMDNVTWPRYNEPSLCTSVVPGSKLTEAPLVSSTTCPPVKGSTTPEAANAGKETCKAAHGEQSCSSASTVTDVGAKPSFKNEITKHLLRLVLPKTRGTK